MVSVTEVLDYFTEPELLAWYKRVGFKSAEAISQESLRVGKVVDGLIQMDLREDSFAMPETDEPARNCLMAWMSFTADHPQFRSQVAGIQTELTDGEVIGHPDCIVTQPTRWGIVDVKTSKQIQPKHWTQVAKYAELECVLHRAPADPLSGCRNRFLGILRLDKATGRYEYQEITDASAIEGEIRVFDAYLTAYRHAQAVREIFRRQLEREALDVA